MTNVESKLWSLLRGRHFLARKFRRQHTIGPYAVDFACPAVRLVIEVDGPSHADAEQQAFDEKRTLYLETAGWRVLRITNDDVYNSIEAVELKILDALGN